MNGDLAPAGGRRKKKATKQQIEEMIEGGKKAQEINIKTTKEHQEIDVPQAEEELLEGLEKVGNNKIKSATK